MKFQKTFYIPINNPITGKSNPIPYIGERGVLCSYHPADTPPGPFNFYLRNESFFKETHGKFNSYSGYRTDLHGIREIIRVERKESKSNSEWDSLTGGYWKVTVGRDIAPELP